MKRRSVLFPLFWVSLSAGGAGCAGALHRSEYLAPPDKRTSVHSAAVLPLENLTAKPDAGKAVADELATELAAKKLVVVDRGRAEAVLGKVDVIPGGTIDRIAAQRLGQVLGVDAVVFGSVAEATDGGDPLGPKKPSLGLSLRVLEVKTGNYLLAGTYSASGDSAARDAAEAIGKAVGR